MHRFTSGVVRGVLASTLGCCFASTLGCRSETKRSQNAPASPSANEVVSVPCQLDTANPGLMRRAGRAKVSLRGHGLSIEREATGVCGPLYNADVAALGVRAGEGLLFEICLPEGYVQLTSKVRATGAQALHGPEHAGGTDVLFNQTGGRTYSQRGLPTDRVVVSEDFWRADADLVLRDVQDTGELRAHIQVDCATPGPN